MNSLIVYKVFFCFFLMFLTSWDSCNVLRKLLAKIGIIFTTNYESLLELFEAFLHNHNRSYVAENVIASF